MNELLSRRAHQVLFAACVAELEATQRPPLWPFYYAMQRLERDTNHLYGGIGIITWTEYDAVFGKTMLDYQVLYEKTYQRLDVVLCGRFRNDDVIYCLLSKLPETPWKVQRQTVPAVTLRIAERLVAYLNRWPRAAT